MAKSKSLKNRAKNFVRSSSKTAEKALPVINNNLKNAGVLSKDVAKETIPVVEKGVSAVYGTMATGFNLGIKGAKNVASNIKSASKKRRSSKRARKSARKTRRKY
jgi:nicotinamide mononucleotide (NMN) deamidase PncC